MINRIQLFLLLLNALGLISIGYAQEQLNYFVYNELNNEISSNTCYNVQQASDGKIYISTDKSLQVFDGLDFKTLSKEESKGLAISSSTEDSSGRIWAHSFYGDIYYTQGDALTTHPISDSINEITEFYRLGDNLYLAGSKTIYKLDYASLELNKIAKFPNKVISLFFYNNTDYALVFAEKDATLLIDLNTLEKHEIPGTSLPLSNSLTYYLSGEPFIYYRELKKSYSLKDIVNNKAPTAKYLPYPGKVNCITGIGESIAIGGMNGLLFYDSNGILQKKILDNIQVSNTSKDEEGNYLVTSLSHGLIQIPNIDASHFSYAKYLNNESIEVSARDKSATIVHGTNAGLLIKHNLLNHQIDSIRISARSEVSAIAIDTFKNHIYAYSDSMYVLDLLNLSIKQKHTTTSIKNLAYTTNNVILGARNGIYILKDSVELLEFNGWNLSICPDEKKGFYTSSKNGFFYIDSLITLSEIKLEAQSFPNNIKSIVRHENGWFYFIGEHQNVYSYHNNKLELFYQHENEGINKIELFGDSLYVLTNKEVKIVSTKTGEKLISIDENKGLFKNKAQDLFHFNGKYYFVHQSTISIFDALPKKNTIAPKLDYQIIGGTFKASDSKLLSEFQNNSLQLEIKVVNNIRARGKTQLLYRINGLSKDWQGVKKGNRALFFERLPFGKFTLEISAKNEDGFPSEKLEIKLKVNPPFYLSTWFLILSFILFIALVYGLIIFFTKRANEINKKKIAAQKLKVRALNAELTAIRSQMNPHFIFNLLTSIQSKVIEGKSNEVYQIIGNFSKLLRNVLDKSGKEFIEVNDELAIIKNYVALENSRLSQAIEFNIEVDETSYFEQIQIPTLITQPFVENAIKHAFPSDDNPKKITLKLRSDESGFTISISDNGVGLNNRSSKKDHQSFAIKSIQDRIKTLGEISIYDISMEIDSSSSGTSIHLHFKFKQQ